MDPFSFCTNHQHNLNTVKETETLEIDVHFPRETLLDGACNCEEVPLILKSKQADSDEILGSWMSETADGTLGLRKDQGKCLAD